jgi:hypothetical protein
MDIKGLAERLTRLEQRQLPFAVMTALNITAEELRSAFQHEMRDSFDRPTQYTLRGIQIKRATKRDLAAEVSLRDTLGKPRPSKVLRAEIEGGPRRMKAYELQLGRRYTVPGREQRLDSYGNLPGGTITRALAQMGILRGGVTQRSPEESAEAAAKLKKRRRNLGKSGKSVYFVGRPGGGRLPEGLWERRKVGKFWVTRPVLLFLDHAPQYEPRLEWEFTAKHVHRTHFETNFRQAMAYAKATAGKG